MEEVLRHDGATADRQQFDVHGFDLVDADGKESAELLALQWLVDRANVYGGRHLVGVYHADQVQ